MLKLDMSFLKTSLRLRLKFLPSGPLLQNSIMVNFLKTRLNNLCVCKNHTGNTSFFDSNDFQKYLLFYESENSKPTTAPSKKVMKILELLRTKRNLETDLKCLREMSSEGSKELEELIKKDDEMLSSKINYLKSEIINGILPVDEDDDRSVELQVVPNIGGEEARLFARELFEMYCNYVIYKNWDHSGGLESGYLFISGDNIYKQLKHETGVHRVQRIPETENLGRTHTSTCTVLVLPQPKPGEVVFNEKEVIVETMRSSGPGGQNVNKTESCVRLTHKPTGIVVENQTSRFQYENKKIAFERLRGIIFNRKQKELGDRVQQLKKQHIGTNIYSDKIRTYNFNQNRITDHRMQFTVHNIKGFLSGGKELDRMIKIVGEYLTQQRMELYIQNVLESEEYKKFQNQNAN